LIPIKPNPLQKGAESNGSFEWEDSRAAEGYVLRFVRFFNLRKDEIVTGNCATLKRDDLFAFPVMNTVLVH
jgi:hypothetical protein